MTYKPPAGVLGHAVAALFRTDPKQALDDDLVRLKSLIETGKTTAHGEEVVAVEVAEEPIASTLGPEFVGEGEEVPGAAPPPKRPSKRPAAPPASPRRAET
jgi:hypothetical protein